MVKTREVKIRRYTCEICGNEYNTKELAGKCEAKGIVVWEDLKIGDVLMRSFTGQECGRGINQAVVVGLVPKDHEIWPVIISLDNPEPQEQDPKYLDGSYIMDNEEIANMKWLFEQSDHIREKINTEQK